MIQNPAHQKLVLDTLCTCLQDPIPAIRAKAAEALGQLGQPTIIPQLIATLHDPDPTVRQAAAIALGQLNQESVIPDLNKLPPNLKAEVLNYAEHPYTQSPAKSIIREGSSWMSQGMG
jgi:cobalamin biosynthesis protein CbiG